MKYTSSANHLILLLCYMAFISGCSKLVEVDPPDKSTTGDAAFGSYAKANEAVMAVFRGMGSMSNVVCGGMSILGALYSGEAELLDVDPDYQHFVTGFISPYNNTLRNVFWVRPYDIISKINACLMGLSKSKGITDAERAQLTGECRFARALTYLYMTSVLGGVPYIMPTSDYEQIEFQGRDRVDMIDSACLEDLLQAKRVLYEQAPVAGYRIRVDKYCAMALLARYYLLKREWLKAEQEATAIINRRIYQLEALDNVFLTHSREAIFQLLPQHASNYAMEAMLIFPVNNKYPKIALSDSLLSRFTPGDQRRSHWVREVTIDNHVYYCPYKFKKRFQHAEEVLPTELTTVIRLAEVYLIRAECRLNRGDLSGAVADLNVIRRRAGLAPVSAGVMDAEAIRDLIERERQLEFFMEGGHSWFDLVRSGKVDVVMAQIKENWDPRRRFFPIPQADLDANDRLTQNPGY